VPRSDCEEILDSFCSVVKAKRESGV